MCLLSRKPRVLLKLTVLWAWISGNAAFKFRGAQQVTPHEAEQILVKHLQHNVSSGRMKDFWSAMQPTFKALPKNAHGHLGHQSLRYILHRVFIQQHGWFIRGLEPSSTPSPANLQGDWIPTYLQRILEGRNGGEYVDLHELAALAATLEDLVGREALGRFEELNQYFNLGNVVSAAEFKSVMYVFMVIFLRNDNVLALDTKELNKFAAAFMRKYEGWKNASLFVDKVFDSEVYANGHGQVDVGKASSVFKSIGVRFYELNHPQCLSLKKILVSMEDVKQGRVRLTHFYNKSFYSHWSFREKPEYLRTLGALDEAEPGVPRLIIPNYVQSMPNCLAPSNLFSVCCRNECEDLMSDLETNIASPMADADQILRIVANLSSDSVRAPWKVPDKLRRYLKEIASSNSGKVPLHGRLFAQWMHHAYPRECSYPHALGSTQPLSPHEWMQQIGGSSIWESDEKLRKFLSNSSCGINGDCNTTATVGRHLEDSELPWSAEEELPFSIKEPEDIKIEAPTLIIASSARIVLVMFSLWYLLRKQHSDEGFNARFIATMARILIICVLAALVDPLLVVATCMGLAMFVCMARVQQLTSSQDIPSSKQCWCAL